MSEYRHRKQIRLKDYDYSQNGAYFVTICTHDRENLFGDIRIDNEVVGADSISARMIERVLNEVIEQYEYVVCPCYVIMPNHFHAIIIIQNPIICDQNIRADMESAPTKPSLSDVIQSFKRYSTIEYAKLVKQNLVPPFNKKVWQRSFYEHIIRNEDDYRKIAEYIENNPAKWEEDRFFAKEVTK